MIDVDAQNITMRGNLMMVSQREDGNPILLFMGDSLDRGLYFFFDKRDPAEGTEYFAGFETYAKPEGQPPSVGYGALPLREWGMAGLAELNGDNVRRNIVAEKVYLQTPAHRNLQTGQLVKAAYYDSKGVPYTSEDLPMGGIYYDAADLGTYIAQDGIYANGRKVVDFNA